MIAAGRRKQENQVFSTLCPGKNTSVLERKDLSKGDKVKTIDKGCHIVTSGEGSARKSIREI